jgi:pimeloyl-ACP methyl ester carboxylesterase
MTSNPDPPEEASIMTGTKAPVVFIHGLWLHASSWAPWQELFAGAGYESFAPGWPGDADTVEGCRADPGSIANRGIDDVTSHYVAFIDELPARPILIGHSFGGMIAEKHSDAVTDLEEFDRGHSLTIDSGWRDVADVCLAWPG